MTEEDYIIIARALRSTIGGGYAEIVDAIVHELGKDNVKFDKRKFWNACGVGEKIEAEHKKHYSS